MAGRGPAPKMKRQNPRDKPERGDWQATPGVGWQHGAVPPPPTGLVKATNDAWRIWMESWFAAYWTPADLPGLRKVVLLYDATERGELGRSTELRQLMDNYGITPKGQQDRRWMRARKEEPNGVVKPAASQYAGLRVVGE